MDPVPFQPTPVYLDRQPLRPTGKRNLLYCSGESAAKCAAIATEQIQRPSLAVGKGAISYKTEKESLFRTLPAAISLYLKKTHNNTFTTQQIESLSTLRLRRPSFPMHSVQQEKRTIMTQPRPLLEAFFAPEHLSLPGFQRFQELVAEVSQYNENPQGHLESRMVQNHAELRLILFYYQCQAYHNFSTDHFRWEGARLQLYQGHGKEAAHHAFLVHIEDACISALKLKFTQQFKEAIKGKQALSPALVVQMISLGVDAQKFERAYQNVLKGILVVEDAVADIFSDCERTNLLNHHSLFYYILNHTLVASPNVNRLDDLLEDQLRSDAKELLERVARGQLTPQEAAQRLAQRMHTTFQQTEAQLNVLAQHALEIGGSIQAYMNTLFFPQFTLGEKAVVVKNFLERFKALAEKMQSLDSLDNPTKRVFRLVYKISSPSLIDPHTYREIQALKAACEKYLQDIDTLVQHKQAVDNIQSMLDSIHHYSQKRNQGIRECKKRQDNLLKFILRGDLKAKDKYDEYETRILFIENEEFQEKLKAQGLMQQQREAIAQGQALESTFNGQFAQLQEQIIKVTPLLEQYETLSDAKDLKEVLSFIPPQKAGSERIHTFMAALPSTQDPRYAALQSHLIARNV